LEFLRQAGFSDERLEQLDGIPRGIFQDDLFPAYAGHDRVAEVSS
jgi:hypothetical protein